MELVVRFKDVTELLQEVKTYLEQVEYWGEDPDIFEERENLKNDIFTLANGIVAEDGRELVDNIEIGDFYLDEFLSKYEPELWANIEEIYENIFD